MSKDLLMYQIDYPFFPLFSYHPIPSGQFPFLLRFLKVAAKLFIVEIKYRLRSFLTAFQS